MSEIRRLSKAEHAALSDDERAERRRAVREKWLSVPENRLRYDAQRRAWRAANTEKERALRSARRHDIYWRDPEKGREKVRDSGRAAYRRDPQRFLLKTQRRRALLRETNDQVTSRELSAIREQFGNRCAYCLMATGKLETDHIEPIDRGGAHVAGNLVPACRSCNASKRDSTLLEWLMRNVRLSPVVRP